MKDRIMGKLTASEDWIIFRTVTKERKSSSLYVRRDDLRSLVDSSQIVAWDSSFAVFTRDRETGIFNIRFYLINMQG